MKRKSIKTASCAVALSSMTFFFQGEASAQNESGNVWVSPFVGMSALNGDNDVIDKFGCDANVLNSYNLGYELGYDFGKLYMFFGLEEEYTDLAKDDVSLGIKTTNVNVNLAYPLWRSNSQRFSLDFRLGVGMYNSNIEYAKETVENVPPVQSIVKQKYNLYLPVGLSFNLFKSGSSSAKINVLYRHSFDTGTTKYFGSDSKLSDYAFNKLGSLYITVGYTFGI